MSAEPGKKPYSGATLESRAISNGLAAPVATSEAPDLAGARMGRGATARAAVAGENPAGARVWEGGADGCADDWYQVIVWARETGRAAPLRRDRLEGLKAVGQARKARARTAGYGKSERTQPAPRRGRAGRSGAGASASANAGLHAGVNAGHTMRDACGPQCGAHANVRTDR